MGNGIQCKGIRKPTGRSQEVATAADLFDTIKILFRSDTDSLSLGDFAELSSLRGHPHMTSTLRRVRGVEKYPNFADKQHK